MSAEFQKTIRASALPPGKIKTVQVGGEDVSLANIDGKYYGIQAMCNHASWDLELGGIQGTGIKCAGHGAVWDLNTGKAEFDEPVDDMPLYDVKVEDDYLYVRKKH